MKVLTLARRNFEAGKVEGVRGVCMVWVFRGLLLGLLSMGFFSVGMSQQGTEGVSQDNVGDAVLSQQGEVLFDANCTVCHKINENYIGPALRDVHLRKEVEWVKRFILNSQKVIASGDSYAVALYEEYNKTEMTSFPFSEAELDALVAYIISESEKPISVAEVSAQGESAASSAGGSSEVRLLWIAVVALLVLNLLVLVVLVGVLRSYALRSGLNEEQKEAIGDGGAAGRKRFFKSDILAGFVIFLFTAIVLKGTLDGLYTIGIQQGYAPNQPIAFSHELHAGTYQIDCNYCHTGASKGKSAGIPSANICMNCHGEIKKDSPEIQKIYAALAQERPIEWVRVHNLPDLSYFNHSQHTVVGGLACQECHGPVETMAVVSQHSPLTMGWCIQCHKQEEIRVEGNGYYDNLQELHTSKGALKVEDIGGLECSKCHY